MVRAYGSRELWLGGVRADGAALRKAAGGGVAGDAAGGGVGADAAADPLDAPVPTCPAWTLGDLLGHLGDVYDRVTRNLPRGTVERPESELATLPPTGPALLDWWDERYAKVLAVLEQVDPELPAWNPWPQAKNAGFWLRRMAHETAVHRWDAQLAVGLPEPVDAPLAADGVLEVLDSWLPAGRRRGRTDVSGLVALCAHDLGREWYVRLRGAGIAVLDTDTILDDTAYRERAVASGTASDLVLALYGRVPFDGLSVQGDQRLLDALRTG